ncbi:uncharacterized protein LOC106738055 [Alligator mississippiensis]|uniref:uncharacterized protein LOC106738055 n=1 Tax=Alligator mississippiensis TaxID=8496 RepID=UPI002877D54F|nr:uncharacterized protein LOC106738055 [Alligator mississippiensis]XP_059583572.1 uncharacterized protein LOC106738055 [Alligator mississippiensis]XP_059583573.1 uncharacterized protein LOC106738055 [Alligator mississippiensis]
MSLREAIVCCKVGNERRCCVCNISHDGRGVPLATGKDSIAEAARQSALDVLRDAVKKKDRVLMETPQHLISCDSEQPQFWMERYAVLTEQRVRDLISVLEEAQFMEDPSREKVLAWVRPKSGDKTIYLCPLFWEAPSHLEKDSQPGTLIHEASHFLGTCDITYEPIGIYVCCEGLMVKNSSTDPDSPKFVPLVPAVLSANNAEYEFERTLRHRGDYAQGRYSCCGEPARSSVCESAVPDELLTCSNTWRELEEMSIGEILRKELLSARDRLQQHVAALQAIADAVDKVHRGATIASITGGTVGIAGGITTVVGLCLAPVTFGASLIVSLTGLGVSLAGGLTSAAATTTDVVQSRVKKEEINGLLGQCQAEVQLIRECMKTLCEKLQQDSGSYFNPDLLPEIPQVVSVAGRTVLHTVKAVSVGKLLASAGLIARITAHALTALTLGLDVFFVAKDSVELHNGAKTELASKIREAVAELERVIDQVNHVYEVLTGEKPELDPEE